MRWAKTPISVSADGRRHTEYFLRFGMAARGSRATFLCKHQGGAQWTPTAAPKRGWAKLYFDHVLQAHEGPDLDFMVGCSGAPILRDSH
jgi:hypothetical protein